MKAHLRESAKRSGQRRRAAGMTLVEILAAMAVMVLLLASLLQLVGSTQRSALMSRRGMDASKAIYSVTDSLARDLQNMANGQGNTIFVKTDGNYCTQLAFLTRSRPPSSSSGARLMAVVYQMSGNQVIRKSAPVTWDQSDSTAAINAAINSSTYGIVSDGILFFEASLELDDGSVVSIPSQSPSGKAWFSGTTLNGAGAPPGFTACVLTDTPVDSVSPRVSRLTVGLAAVESQTMRLPNVPGMTGALQSAALPDGQMPYSIWQQSIDNGKLNGFPAPAVASLQMGQRSFQIK